MYFKYRWRKWRYRRQCLSGPYSLYLLCSDARVINNRAADEDRMNSAAATWPDPDNAVYSLLFSIRL